jgi:hypothetical protein
VRVVAMQRLGCIETHMLTCSHAGAIVAMMRTCLPSSCDETLQTNDVDPQSVHVSTIGKPNGARVV